MKQTLLIVLVGAVLLFLGVACHKQQSPSVGKNPTEQEFINFISRFESDIAPLFKDWRLKEYESSVTGTDEDYNKFNEAKIKGTAYFSNKQDFEFLKKIRDSRQIKDALLARELEVIYNQYYLPEQVSPEKRKQVIDLETSISQKYSTFRADVNGKKLSDNDVEEILRSSTQSPELQAAWEGSKKVGGLIQDDLKKVIKLRNEIAHELGFKNYHEMSLTVSGQNPQEVSQIFDELDQLTRAPFAVLKAEIDAFLANRYGIAPEALAPWHYQNRFFQEAPRIYNVELDSYFKDKDVVKLAKDFYASIGLDSTDILARSDLYEKPGKQPSAFCQDIDRLGDVRIFQNVRPDENWMNTTLHELGHAVYSKYHDKKLPYILRDAAHTFTTEGIAQIFGRLSKNNQWLQSQVGLSQDEIAKISNETSKSFRLDQLVFSRWAQVMYRFEKATYENPDQDLNELWWKTVEQYQMIKKPAGRAAPDWASKIHFVIAPCYYHNYLLGELFASQLWFTLANKVLKTDPLTMNLAGHPEVGQYLTSTIFAPGMRYPWNEMIERATGEKLSAKYYTKQVVGE